MHALLVKTLKSIQSTELLNSRLDFYTNYEETILSKAGMRTTDVLSLTFKESMGYMQRSTVVNIKHYQNNQVQISDRITSYVYYEGPPYIGDMVSELIGIFNYESKYKTA